MQLKTEINRITLLLVSAGQKVEYMAVFLLLVADMVEHLIFEPITQ